MIGSNLTGFYYSSIMKSEVNQLKMLLDVSDVSSEVLHVEDDEQGLVFCFVFLVAAVNQMSTRWQRRHMRRKAVV